MNTAVRKEFLGPVFGASPEIAGQGTGGNLHPNPHADILVDDPIIGLDPFEPLRMRENGDKSTSQNVKKQIVEALRQNIMRRLEQDVSAVIQGQYFIIAQACEKIGPDMSIAACHKGEVDSVVPQLRVEFTDTLANVCRLIVVEARQEMRRACHHSDAVIDRHARHIQRGREIGRAVIDARKNMAMQINHLRSPADRCVCPDWWEPDGNTRNLR